MIKRKTLWMRFVDFENVKKLLHLIHENNGKLRAVELERLGIKKGIFIKKESTEPMSHTPRYHYRKVMENLDLVEIRDMHYYVSERERVQKFLRATDFGSSMSQEAKEILRDIIVENEDCKRHFFDIFVDRSYSTLDDLRRRGTYVVVKTASMEGFIHERWMVHERVSLLRKRTGTIVLENPLGKVIELRTQDEIHAVYWGIRLWAVELGITNEIMTSFGEGRIIYLVNPDFSKKVLGEKIADHIEMDESDSEWSLIHIPSFIKDVALSNRFSVDEMKNFILEMKRRHPSLIMFVPTSTLFIDIRTPFEKQDSVIRNLYVYEKGKGYISHMRVRKNILEEVLL